jgi:hypothetical protein
MRCAIMQDVVAEMDAFITDKDAFWPRDKLGDFLD